MDNRYLCRGKRSDNLNQEWVIGHYVSVPRHMIVLAEKMRNGNWNCFDIDLSTLGQCTGLSAKKSYRGDRPEDLLIWEGDVLSDGQEEWNVEYGEMACGMQALSLKTSVIFNLYRLTHFGNEGRSVEIIGTIHDDPEGGVEK